MEAAPRVSAAQRHLFVITKGLGREFAYQQPIFEAACSVCVQVICYSSYEFNEDSKKKKKFKSVSLGLADRSKERYMTETEHVFVKE
ncbi:hypothetical protein EAE96_010822 [Botrytis aclada]|nr:hypothetical protein EAE96_010822 [Botrytis aclada]